MARPRTKPRSGLGLLIQQLREGKHLTIAELCQQSGLSRSIIEKVESSPDIRSKRSTYDRIAAALGEGDSQKLFEKWRKLNHLQLITLTIRESTYLRTKEKAEAANLTVEEYLSGLIDEIMATRQSWPTGASRITQYETIADWLEERIGRHLTQEDLQSIKEYGAAVSPAETTTAKGSGGSGSTRKPTPNTVEVEIRPHWGSSRPRARRRQ